MDILRETWPLWLLGALIALWIFWPGPRQHIGRNAPPAGPRPAARPTLQHPAPAPTPRYPLQRGDTVLVRSNFMEPVEDGRWPYFEEHRYTALMVVLSTGRDGAKLATEDGATVVSIPWTAWAGAASWGQVTYYYEHPGCSPNDFYYTEYYLPRRAELLARDYGKD